MSITRDDTLNWVKSIASVIGENSTYLTQLDAAIGDADHGANMDRGFKAVMNKLPEISDKDIGTIFKTIGMTLISTVGGAGGPLYGTFFLQVGMKTAGKMELSLADWTDALEAGFRPTQQPAHLGFRFTAAILLEPEGKGTRYKAIAMHADADARQKHDAMGFRDGWGTVLDQLVEHMQRA